MHGENPKRIEMLRVLLVAHVSSVGAFYYGAAL